MQINYLNDSEKIRTRAMWERIFSEDTERFLDYYYREKNRDNEILSLSEGGREVSMLHLNPYMLKIGTGHAKCHYIVAVATEPEYRHRGYMASLLKESFGHMYERKEPFTFLMPANEAIYLPFDFRFVYDQEKKKVSGKGSARWNFHPVDGDFSGELAGKILLDYGMDVAAVRDKVYYRRQLLEQKSENGGIMIAMEENEPAGLFLYGKEDGYEIMEPFLRFSRSKDQRTRRCEYEEFLQACVYSLTGEKESEVLCRGLLYPGDESEPMIMARIIHLETFFSLLEPVCDFRMEIAVTDPLIRENEGVFRLNASGGKISAEKIRNDVGGMDSYSISELVQVLFGYRGRDDFAALLKPLSKVFLNEVV